MDIGRLSLDQAPPIGLPLRFFLTAPWFAAAAGLLLASQGESALVSRWSPAALAATHLLALGFLGQVICGALLQLLPVIAGAPVPRVRWVGGLTHFCLTLGTPLLAAGLLGAGAWALGLGAATLALGLAVFTVAAGAALARSRGAPATRIGLTLGALALAVAVALGLVLAGALIGWLSLPAFPDWVQVHLLWGLLGWVGLTLVAVAYQAVPLFHVTPPYPGWLSRALAPLLALTLALGSATLLGGRTAESGLALALLALGYAVFAATTLVLQARRSRPRLDATLVHWRLAMGSILAAALAWSLGAPAEPLGVLLLVGVGVGLPSGMLLKIVPFLCWFHLQSRQLALGRFDLRVPHMHRLLPEAWARWHPAIHGGALALLAGATWLPALARPAGLALMVSALWLAALLGLAAWRYGGIERGLLAPPTVPGPAVRSDP
jgi:hypothetical protein